MPFAFFYIEIEEEGKNKKEKSKQIFPFFAGNDKLTSRTKRKVEGEKKRKSLSNQIFKLELFVITFARLLFQIH